ncbi:DUF5711 family protein [Ruminococcus sp.]|uniref:DUF5711 family protein n=1 Tax=Ruminococcus sp. TaxID=41978 RepID=UPI00386556E0
MFSGKFVKSKSKNNSKTTKTKSKGHRFAETKVKKNDRDVISYEDMPLEDYELEKTEMSPEAVKKIIVSVCIVLAAGLVVFAFANRDRLSPESIANWWTYDVLGNAGNGYPVTITGTEVNANNFVLSDGHIAYASDTSFVTLNSSGSDIFNTQLKYSKPILVSNKNMFLTYDLGGKGYEINSLDKQLFASNTDDDIYTADIASNGVYAIATEGNGYLSSLLVFNKDNNRIYKYSFSEYYITSVTLNSNGTACAACGISTENGKVVSAVYLLDFSKEEPVQVSKIEGDVIIAAKYLTDNRVAIVGNSASYVVKNGDENIVTNSYDSMTLSNYFFNMDTSTFAVALSRSGDGRSCTVFNYDSNGSQRDKIETDSRADAISIYKDKIALLDGNIANVYNTRGDKIYASETGAGSKNIILSSDTTAYVLSVNQIRFVELSKNQVASEQVATEQNTTEPVTTKNVSTDDNA